MTNLEFSDQGDAPCPNCGHLLWLTARLLSAVQEHMADRLGIAADRVSPESNLVELGADSLDVVELIMELEEEVDVDIPDEDAERIRSVGDAIRYLEQRKRGS